MTRVQQTSLLEETQYLRLVKRKMLRVVTATPYTGERITFLPIVIEKISSLSMGHLDMKRNAEASSTVGSKCTAYPHS